MNENILTVITACVAALAGYYLKWHQNDQKFEKETQINERDLLSRIDGLQKQIVDMARENAQLRTEIAGLRDELRYMRSYSARRHKSTYAPFYPSDKRKRQDAIAFNGADYAEGNYD